MSTNKQGYECPKCKNNYSTAYSMYRHMRKVHNCDINRCVTLYCPIENCNQSYDRYNALDTHLTHVHYADIRKETFNFSDLSDFEAWLRDITSSSKTKYIKRSCNNSYRYYRCHRSGLPKTSTDKINTMKSSVKIGRHCPSRIIAKITDRNVQVEFVPTHIGHECEIAKIPLSQKKRLDIACRLANSTNSAATSTAAVAVSNEAQRSTLQTSNDHLQTSQAQANLQTTISQRTAPITRQGTNTNNVTVNPVDAGDQATASSLIQDNSPLIMTLAPMKTSEPEQHIGHPLQQQPQSQAMHLMPAQLTTPRNAQITSACGSHNGGVPPGGACKDLSLLPMTNPSRPELTTRFEQLLATIRSDKHASIVKAQLEVCFALVRD